jgi:hypothetical protein
MFTKLAKFRLFEPRRIAPGPGMAPHSNDNLLGFRRPAGRRLRPNPVPACHWYLIDGRLECRWQVDVPDETAIGGIAHENGTGRPSGTVRDALKTCAIA